MDDLNFELVDNARTGLQHFSLERLKTIAPTFRERSAQRLACVELIAEKERELARLQMGTVSRKASLALILATIAITWPLLVLAAWIYFQPLLKKPEPVQSRPTTVARPLPSPTSTPEPAEPDSTPEPLPAALGELPTKPGGG
ncbi:MAG: hypothetical protein ACKOHM_10250 [Spartobacteria bacterium]